MSHWRNHIVSLLPDIWHNLIVFNIPGILRVVNVHLTHNGRRTKVLNLFVPSSKISLHKSSFGSSWVKLCWNCGRSALVGSLGDLFSLGEFFCPFFFLCCIFKRLLEGFCRLESLIFLHWGYVSYSIWRFFSEVWKWVQVWHDGMINLRGIFRLTSITLFVSTHANKISWLLRNQHSLSQTFVSSEYVTYEPDGRS